MKLEQSKTERRGKAEELSKLLGKPKSDFKWEDKHHRKENLAIFSLLYKSIIPSYLPYLRLSSYSFSEYFCLISTISSWRRFNLRLTQASSLFAAWSSPWSPIKLKIFMNKLNEIFQDFIKVSFTYDQHSTTWLITPSLNYQFSLEGRWLSSVCLK